ncbi:MAG: hypothetical protein WEC00_05955 [Dongiaceae bacterium]
MLRGLVPFFVIAGVLVALLVTAGVFAPSYRACTAEHETDDRQEQQATTKNKPENGILVFAVCQGRYIDANKGTFTLIATIAIAAFTGTLWRSTDKLWQASRDQAGQMDRSIAESARSATAMELAVQNTVDNAAAFKRLSKQQMRAYVSIVVGGALYQESAKNLPFVAMPQMLNTGHTPAHRVAFVANARILPVPISDDFDFPLPGNKVGGAVLGPQQTFKITVPTTEFCNDTEVEHIKAGNRRALCVWGKITYEDVFGDEHFTKFCQIITWLGDGTTINGGYHKHHNEAD